MMSDLAPNVAWRRHFNHVTLSSQNHVLTCINSVRVNIASSLPNTNIALPYTPKCYAQSLPYFFDLLSFILLSTLTHL